ncbi:MAG: acyl--CoA ligase [Actinobacteria bacterium]|nr:acyl--CoA ligase [Actinomycetota bacterium]
MVKRDEIEAQLTGPGGAFEVVTEKVGDHLLKVYKQRMGSLREVSRLAASRSDDEICIVYGSRRIGYRSFFEAADRFSSVLGRSLGVKLGDRVAVLSANTPEWCLSFWATVDIGAVLVGLNGWWKRDEIIFGLADCGARVLVADRDRFTRVAGSISGLKELESVLVTGVSPEEANQLSKGDPRVHSFDEVATSLRENALVAPEDRVDEPLERYVDEDAPAVIFYTSGTTGHPKGAVSTHRSMLANLQNTIFHAVASAMESPQAGLVPQGGAQQVALLTSPLFHVSGCHSGLVVGVATGMRLVIPKGRFDPEIAMDLIEKEKVTVWATVPTMVWRVVNHPRRGDFDLSSVRSVAYGGSPAAPELQRKVTETFVNLATMGNAYGLTESSSVATVNSGARYLERPESVGRPLPVVDVKVVNPAGEELPAGSTGEILIRGPIVMKGYWDNTAATQEAISDGWLHSGDIGYLDSDGFLYVTDRAKDMIIRGGENIYCVEIENLLVEHPGIAEAAVIGVFHAELGEEVKAIVVPQPGGTITEDDVRDWVAQKLANFKVPTYVEIRTQPLPRNPSGKVLKNVLRGDESSLAELL